MKRFDLRIPNFAIALACLGLTNACYIETNKEDEGTGGASAGSGGASAGSGGQSNSGGQTNSGGASAGSGGQTNSGGQSNSGGSAGQAAGGSAGLPGVGGSAGSAGAGGSSGLPWPVKTCNDLCQYQPEVTAAETQCATVQAELKGYPVTKTPACYDILSIAQCNGCYAAVKASDADCAAIGNTCLN